MNLLTSFAPFMVFAVLIHLGLTEPALWAGAAVAAGRRRISRTPAAVDLLAAVPLVSATTLAAALGLSVKAAGAILDQLVRREVAVEVTHHHRRRLFGLAGLAPLREAAAPLARRAFDYGDLAAAMQAVDAALRTARAGLARAAGSGGTDDDAAG